MQRPLAQPHRTRQLHQTSAGPQGRGQVGGHGCGGVPPSRRARCRNRLHTCAKCIWSRSTRGFVFSIKKKKANKKPVTAFVNRKENKTENTSLSRRIKKGMKYWFIQSTAACGLKITLFNGCGGVPPLRRARCRNRLHTCAKCIWSRSTRGFVFSIKKKKQTKNQ
ncbi:hypothetical protein D623_10019565 [Myotis brandtii]|uniref:Uncharacterized protein n=1 Tax=Myotis brandtii TaxID=109478 RepID=S7Q926_MYOBR|nr:hypothetical protein D623_10019565 [Myotis brandtii]